ncbi:unnamed protein product, partial [Ascophyllum nodosum]
SGLGRARSSWPRSGRSSPTDWLGGIEDETSVKVEGRLAYAPQEPWIQWGTVR